MTTISQSQLVAPTVLPNADATLGTVVPVGTFWKIGRAVFCNTTAGVVTLTVGITTGGALAAGTTLISARGLAPGETYVSPELAGQVLPPGSAIRAYSNTATAITAAVSGIAIQG